MKRLLTFLLVPGMVLGSIGPVGADQFRAQGAELRNISEPCILSSELMYASQALAAPPPFFFRTIGRLRSSAPFAFLVRFWRRQQFDRLAETDVFQAARAVGSATAIVGIPFYKEIDNIEGLVESTKRELEKRGMPAAIIVVGEFEQREFLAHVPEDRSALVRVIALTKPPSFSQPPGPGRRSWSHRLIWQIAHRLDKSRPNIVFIDADVLNRGWVSLFLNKLKEGADFVTANYARGFTNDDALVHLEDYLTFSTIFGAPIRGRHGGEYAMKWDLVNKFLNDTSLKYDYIYTLDSQLVSRVVRTGLLVTTVDLDPKRHKPITNLFARLPEHFSADFEDIRKHLVSLILAPMKPSAALAQPIPASELKMNDLAKNPYRDNLFQEFKQRFGEQKLLLRKILGRLYPRFKTLTLRTTDQVAIDPEIWALAAFQFILYFAWRANTEERKNIGQAYVAIVAAGSLGFLNRTRGMSVREAFKLVDEEYLPAFRRIWRRMARFYLFHLLWTTRRLPVLILRFMGHRARSFPLFRSMTLPLHSPHIVEASA